MFTVLRNNANETESGLASAKSMGWGAALLASILVMLLTGFPNGPFSWDWIKHWALLEVLTEKAWPVSVDDLSSKRQWLRFYFGAYLVPAGVASTTRLSVVTTTAVWYCVGLALVFRHLQLSLTGRSKGAVSLLPFVFLLVNGADTLAQHSLRGLLQYDDVTWYSTHSEAWSALFVGRPLQYSGILAQFTWVPHQAIASALATLIVLRLRDTRNVGTSALALGFLTLHSPYAAIGLAPFVLNTFIVRRHTITTRGEWFRVAFTTLSGAAFALTVVLFLKGDLPSGALLCVGCQPSPDAIKIGVFLIVELSGMLLCLTRQDFNDRTTIIALLLLCTLPLLGGKLADPVMRISLPAIVVLGVRASENLVSLAPSAFTVRPAIALRIVGLTLMTTTAISEAGFHRHLAKERRSLPSNDYLSAKPFTDYAEKTSYSVREFLDRCGWEFRAQYFSESRPLLIRRYDQ